MIRNLFIIAAYLISPFSIIADVKSQSLVPASGWYNYSNDTIPSKKDWINNFVRDCAKLKYQNQYIPTHIPNNSIVRVATYNIHFWCKPGVAPFNYATGTNRHTIQDIEGNFENIIAALKSINADIVCLQEILLFNKSFIENRLRNLGYEHIYFFHEADWAGNLLCIAIASKYPFLEQPEGKTFKIDNDINAHPLEKHCFLKISLSLSNNKKVTIYTSHFDCYDNSEKIRYEEVKEIIEDIIFNSSTDNYIVCGDFNAVRSEDLQYLIGEYMAWDLLNRDNMGRTKIPTPTKALDLFAAHGFEDCFKKSKISMPKFSVWNGTVVDCIFLNKNWSLPITGCYFYYTSASDHLPVILDIKV